MMKFNDSLIHITYQPSRLLGEFFTLSFTDRSPISFGYKCTSQDTISSHLILMSLKNGCLPVVPERRPH